MGELPHYIIETMYDNEKARDELLRKQKEPFYLLGDSMRMLREGNQWMAIHAPPQIELHEFQFCVAGFGDTPEQAIERFNYEWEHKDLVKAQG